MDGESMAPYPMGRGLGVGGRRSGVFQQCLPALIFDTNAGFTSDPFITVTAIVLLAYHYATESTRVCLHACLEYRVIYYLKSPFLHCVYKVSLKKI